MGVENNLLETKVGLSKIDCTSRVVNILDFCKKKTSKRQNLIRGRVDVLSKNNVVCEYAKSVVLKIKCGESSFNCTTNAKEDCRKLKSVFAYSLEMTHASKIENKLTCIYTEDTPLDI